MNRLAKHSRIAGPAQPRSVRGPQTLSGVFHIALGALISLGGCVAERDAGPLEEPRVGAPLEIEAEAVLSVGVVAGDSLREFDRVRTPFVFPDGRLFVPLGGSHEIRVFTGEGEFVERLGGRGEGPGEFVDLSEAWPRGDTIEAFDSRARRVSRFLPDGSVEVVPITGGSLPDLSLPGGPLERGWAFGGVAGTGDDGRDRVVFHHFDRTGDHLGVLGSIGGLTRHTVAGSGGPEPLSPRAVAASDGTYLYLGETLVPSIRRVRSPGIVDGEIAWEPTESVSAEAALEQVIDVATSRLSADRGFFTRERLQAAPVPDELSVFWDFLPDPEGFLWVQPYQPLAHAFALGATPRGGVGNGGAWRVLTADGRYAGSIEVPDGLELTQITRTSVVGIRRDELGVESVHVHRVRRN